VGAAANGALAVRAVAQDTIQNTLLDRVRWDVDKSGFGSAMIEGSETASGMPYSELIRIPAGRWIAPHWHTKGMHVVVLSGALLIGTGDRIDSANAQVLPVGSISFVPPRKHHYEGGRGETIILLYGIGPLTTQYVHRPDSLSAGKLH